MPGMKSVEQFSEKSIYLSLLRGKSGKEKRTVQVWVLALI